MSEPNEASPAQVAANQANAGKSTGPRTQSGKRRAKLNGLRRSLRSTSFCDSMLPLGEDPAEYDRLYRDLLVAYEPKDALWAKQVEDLAQLYWDKARLDRGKAGFLREQMERWERARLRRRREMDLLVQDTPLTLVLELGLRRTEDSPEKFRAVLSRLKSLLGAAERRDFRPDYRKILELIYGRQQTWQACKISELFDRVIDAKKHGHSDAEDVYKELQSVLEEEIRAVREDYDLFMREHVKISPAARDARLAPMGRKWTWIIREENVLNRAIDRKVKILMGMKRNQKSEAGSQKQEIEGPKPEKNK